jgi:hypothetical protein
MERYPVTSRRSVIDCPVHAFTVALDEYGRVSTPCPGCISEARKARRRLALRRPRRLAVV